MQDHQPPKTPLTIPSWNGLHTSSKFFLQTSPYGQQCGHMGYIRGGFQNPNSCPCQVFTIEH